MLKFTDLTMYVQLKREEEKSRLLSALNMSVHHEMLTPLKANVDLASCLIKHLNQENGSAWTREMAKAILV